MKRKRTPTPLERRLMRAIGAAQGKLEDSINLDGFWSGKRPIDVEAIRAAWRTLENVIRDAETVLELCPFCGGALGRKGYCTSRGCGWGKEK